MIQFQLTYVAVLLLGGMLIRNTVGLPKLFQAGAVAARPIIKPGIVILGAYYLWSDVLKVGTIGLSLVVPFAMGTAVLISVWGRKANVDDGLAGVMGGGVGVCGVSAAVAAAPVVNAKPNELGVFSAEHKEILGIELLKNFFAVGFAGVGLNICDTLVASAGLTPEWLTLM